MTFYLSGKKSKELVVELENLTTVGRENIAKKLDIAKSFGDLKENAEYHQAREDQGKMEARIIEIESILRDNEIIECGSCAEVKIGATVTISKKGSIKKTILTIVGTSEIDISAGKISYQSPLAITMRGKKEGDVFNFTLPSGDIVNYKVVKIK